jgi:8-amino-7-oxononanoate synthase
MTPNQATGRRTLPASSAPSDVKSVLSRLLIRSGLTARAKIGGLAQVIADACSAQRSQTIEYSSHGPASSNFCDLPAYRGIVKHREIGKLFSIADPFYRSHDAHLGAETWMQGRRYVNFASYDYLGLNQHRAVAAAAREAIDQFGTSVSASRIVAGERPVHRALETALADFYGVESAVAFVSGHATNVSTIGTLMNPDDLIIYDELAHNSVLVGAKLSRATARAFRHNDLGTLEHILAANRHLHKRALIVVEGLYSMDGDVANLPALIALKTKYDAWLMVDEAHALGVLGAQGRGSAEHFGVDTDGVDIWMGTLSKTLAACGGYIAGKQQLIDILKYQAPGLVYSVGLSPPLAAAAAAALEVLQKEPERVQRLQANGKLFLSLAKAAGLDTATSEGHAICSIIVGDLINAGRLSDRLLARGLNVLPIIYPAVPLKAARFRFFITSTHTSTQIRNAVQTVRDELTVVDKRRKAA